MGSGSVDFTIPPVSKICLDKPFIQPINLVASSTLNSFSPFAIIDCNSLGI
jgi:hypothetical protein